jgi:hypothetical protein
LHQLIYEKLVEVTLLQIGEFKSSPLTVAFSGNRNCQHLPFVLRRAELGTGVGVNRQKFGPHVFYHDVHLNSRLDFSDAPVSRDLALTGETYNFGE